MQSQHVAAFDDLRRAASDGPIAPVASAAEARRLIQYLRDLGFAVATSGDVRSAIDAAMGEEELAAHSCMEGVAVSHASDGWWLLFPHGSVGFEPPLTPLAGERSAGSEGWPC